MSTSHPSRRFSTGRLVRPSPNFVKRSRVILHRSVDTPLLGVVRVVRELTRFAEAEAMSRMWDAYHRGKAVVLTTYNERAEFLKERFAELGLHVTLEPV